MGVSVQLLQRPQWVLPHLCVDCEKCLTACPVDLSNGGKPLFQVTVPTNHGYRQAEDGSVSISLPH